MKMRFGAIGERRNTVLPRCVCSLLLPARPCCRPAFVERALPLADDRRRNAIADQVRWCGRLRHQPVDAEHEGNTLDRDGSDGGEGCCQYDESGTGDAGRLLRGEQKHRQQAELLFAAERRVCRLREDGGGCEIESNPVEVERVSGRDDKADHTLLAAQALELGDHARQHRLRRGGRDH
jgi:hypothetical protein